MGTTEELASLLEKQFPKYVILEPQNELVLHGLLYVYLTTLGYHVNYTGGRAQPDFVVRKKRGKTEVPIEVKLTGTARSVEEGVKQLLDYMKQSEWKTGILYIWDKSKKAAAHSKAKNIRKLKKYNRSILLVSVKPKS